MDHLELTNLPPDLPNFCDFDDWDELLPKDLSVQIPKSYSCLEEDGSTSYEMIAKASTKEETTDELSIRFNNKAAMIEASSLQRNQPSTKDLYRSTTVFLTTIGIIHEYNSEIERYSLHWPEIQFRRSSVSINYFYKGYETEGTVFVSNDNEAPIRYSFRMFTSYMPNTAFFFNTNRTDGETIDSFLCVLKIAELAVEEHLQTIQHLSLPKESHGKN